MRIDACSSGSDRSNTIPSDEGCGWLLLVIRHLDSFEGMMSVMEAVGLRQSIAAANLDNRLAVSSATNAASEFKITEILGQGSFGAVYQATHVATGLDVALKAIPFAGSSRRQVQQEIANLHRVRHLPGVSAIFGCVVCSDKVFIAMELVHGQSLQALMNTTPKCVMSLPALHTLVKQLASTLRGMHERGVLHRDVKPGNIIIEDNTAAAKLIDFGLSIEHWEQSDDDGGAGQTHAGEDHFDRRGYPHGHAAMQGKQHAVSNRWTTLRGREVVHSVLKLAAPLNTGRVSVEVDMAETNRAPLGQGAEDAMPCILSGYNGADHMNYRWKNIYRFLQASKGKRAVSIKAGKTDGKGSSQHELFAGGSLLRMADHSSVMQDLKLATASAGLVVYSSPTPLRISWYVGKQRLGLAALCSLAYVELQSGDMNKLMNEGRSTVASQLRTAMRLHSLAMMMPSFKSKNTSPFSPVGMGSPTNAQRRCPQSFVSCVDGSTVANVSIMNCLGQMEAVFGIDGLTHDAIVIPEVKSSRAAYGAIRLLKRWMEPWEAWVRSALRVSDELAFDLASQIAALWRTIVPPNVSRATCLADDDSPIDSLTMPPRLHGSASGSQPQQVSMSKREFAVRHLLPHVVFVLAPGTSDEVRREVDALAQAAFSCTVLHAYSTPACVDVHVLRKCRLRAAAYQSLLVSVDPNVQSWRRSFPRAVAGMKVDSMMQDTGGYGNGASSSGAL